MKPDGKLPHYPQLMERLTPVAAVLMCRFIAGLEQAAKQLRDLGVDDLAVPKLVDQVALGFMDLDRNTCVGRCVPGQEFNKRARLP